MNEHRTVYPCSCGANEYLDISIYQDDGEDMVCIWTAVNPPRRFVDRLRGAWGILTGRDYYVNSEVILSREQVVGLWQDLRSRVGGMEAYSITWDDDGNRVWERIKASVGERYG